jgi:hypothetical protein
MQAILFAILNVAPFAVALALGLLLPALGVLCYSRLGAGMAVIVGMYAIEALWMQVGGLELGITVYYTDLALLFIGAIAMLRLLTARDVPRWHWAWSLYVLAFAFSLGSGIVSFGSGAGVQARLYFYSIAAGSYAMSFPVDAGRVRILLNLMVWLALLLLGICVYRWIVYYTPIPDLLPPEGNYNVDGAIRVIRSYEALALGQVFIAGLLFASFGRGALAARFIAPLTLAGVLALQHRSVWLAVLVGVMAGLFVARSRSGSKLGQVLLLAGIVTVTALPMAFSSQLSGVTDQVASSAERGVEGDGTVGERFDNWQGLIKLWAAGGPRSLVFGQSFGSDATRYVQDKIHGGEHKIGYFAHNHYVQTLFNLGLAGLFAFLAVVWYVARGLYRRCASATGDPVAEVLLALLLMQLAYYVPYGTDYLQSVVLGLCIAYVAGHERVERAAAAAARPAVRQGLRWNWS